MSEIIKSEAIVISKINYGDTSNIATIFTRDHGKISVIIKGGRSGKTKLGAVVDPLSYLSVIYYNKQSRDIQILTSAEIISHFANIKDDLKRIEFSFAVIELIKELMAESEINSKIFDGSVRILERINDAEEEPAISFGRFFLFFAKEIGYELQLGNCAICKTTELSKNGMTYSFEKGLICGTCTNQMVEFYDINLELFQYLNCLKFNVDADKFSDSITAKAIRLIENHLKYHISTFKGINSFNLFNKR